MPSNRNSAPTPPGRRLNTSLSSPHSPLPPQSSHSAIEIPANLMKTLTKTFLNRHTFGVFAFSSHCPLTTDRRLFPFWPGSPKPKGKAGPAAPKPTGEGGYSTHPGGRHSRNSLKTLAASFPTRHTHSIFVSSSHPSLATCP